MKVDLHNAKWSAASPFPLRRSSSISPLMDEVVSADQGTKDAQGHTLSVIDTKAMTARSTVTTGAGLHGVVVDDSGTWAWVTNSFDNTVTAVDLVVHRDAPDSPSAPSPAASATRRDRPRPPGQQHNPRHPSPSNVPPGES